jgi:hypothetical protein
MKKMFFIVGGASKKLPNKSTPLTYLPKRREKHYLFSINPSMAINVYLLETESNNSAINIQQETEFLAPLEY